MSTKASWYTSPGDEDALLQQSYRSRRDWVVCLASHLPYPIPDIYLTALTLAGYAPISFRGGEEALTWFWRHLSETRTSPPRALILDDYAFRELASDGSYTVQRLRCLFNEQTIHFPPLILCTITRRHPGPETLGVHAILDPPLLPLKLVKVLLAIP